MPAGRRSDCGGISRKYPAEHRAWVDAIRRCTNANHPAWSRYGSRGIAVCPGWIDDFQAFLEHIGPRPSSEFSLDRIDNDRGYEPGNVRWATRKEQNRNRGNSKLTRGAVDAIRWLRFVGFTVTDLASDFGVSFQTIHRVDTGEIWGDA